MAFVSYFRVEGYLNRLSLSRISRPYKNFSCAGTARILRIKTGDFMIKGSCHCGQVKWSYHHPTESVTACNCNLCRRYGALWAYGFHKIDAQVEGQTNAYEYAKKHSRYHFCPNCGGLAFYLANRPDENGNFKIAVNFRMASDPDLIQHLRIDHFDGFDKFEDLPSDGKTVKDLWF